MGTQADSSDESDPGGPRDGTSRIVRTYRRINPFWRSRSLAQFLWALDDISYQQRVPKIGCRRVAGATPRLRLPAIAYSDHSIAPAGLPRNCYNEDWLRTLWRYEVDALQMQNWDYDFTISTSRPLVFPVDSGLPDPSATASGPSAFDRFPRYSVAHPVVQPSPNISALPSAQCAAASGPLSSPTPASKSSVAL